MKLRDIAQRLELQNLTPTLTAPLEVEITGGHCTDLMSDVLAHAPRGGVLVTIQSHLNAVAVAAHAELAAVIIAGGRRPEDAIIEKALEEGIALFVARQSAFDVVGRLFEFGVRGSQA